MDWGGGSTEADSVGREIRKFGSTIGEYTGYIPYSPATILLLLDYGFNFNCEKKKNYISGLEKAWKAYKILALADNNSGLSSILTDIPSVLLKILASHAAPVLRTITITWDDMNIPVQMQEMDTAADLIEKGFRSHKMVDRDSIWLAYMDDSSIPQNTLVRDIKMDDIEVEGNSEQDSFFCRPKRAFSFRGHASLTINCTNS